MICFAPGVEYCAPTSGTTPAACAKHGILLHGAPTDLDAAAPGWLKEYFGSLNTLEVSRKLALSEIVSTPQTKVFITLPLGKEVFTSH